MSKFRSSQSIQAVLLHLLHSPADEAYGAEISRVTGLSSSHLYPALARLRKHGFVTDHWEDVNPVAEHRPRRRLYTLTSEGVELAQQERATLSRLHHTLLPGGAL